MTTFIDGLRDGIRDGLCNIMSGAAEFEDFFGTQLNPWGTPYYNLSRGAYRLYCNREPPPRPQTQFPNGQCPVAYSVTFSYEYRLNSQNWIADVREFPCGAPVDTIHGPIGRLERVVSGNAVKYVLSARDADGNPRDYDMTDTFNLEVGDIRNGSYTADRCDSQPDNCGTPTPVPPPSGYRDITINVNYTDNSGNTFNIPVGLFYVRPTINVFNRVFIPVRITFTDPLISIPVRFTANFDLTTGDINFNIGGDEGYDDRGGGEGGGNLPEAPLPDPDPDDESPDIEPPEDETTVKRIVGVVVDTVTLPENQSAIFNETGVPDIYVPRIVWVLFRVRIGEGSTAWLKHIPVNLLREFIPVPWEEGAIDYAIANPNGAVVIATPIYKKFAIPTEED